MGTIIFDVKNGIGSPEAISARKYVPGVYYQSSSPFAAPVLFAMKCDGGLRFCIDYRDVNSKTIKNRYPLPMINKMLNLFGNAKVYTKLDMRGAYNLL